MKEGDKVKLSSHALLLDLYPPSMNGVMIMGPAAPRRNTSALVAVLCEDGNTRVAELCDLTLSE